VGVWFFGLLCSFRVISLLLCGCAVGKPRRGGVLFVVMVGECWCVIFGVGALLAVKNAMVSAAGLNKSFVVL